MRSDIIQLINSNTVDIGLLYSRYSTFFGAIDPSVFNQTIRMYAQSVGVLKLYRWKIEEYEINVVFKDKWFKAY